VVTDMRMSGMTGLELHDHLAQSGKTIPTILVTAFPNDRDRARSRPASSATWSGLTGWVSVGENDE
jgi:CheY-like chemotaxis protein